MNEMALNDIKAVELQSAHPLYTRLEPHQLWKYPSNRKVASRFLVLTPGDAGVTKNHVAYLACTHACTCTRATKVMHNQVVKPKQHYSISKLSKQGAVAPVFLHSSSALLWACQSTFSVFENNMQGAENS